MMSLEPLNEYESKVVTEIATWKSQPADLFTRVTSGLAKPFAWTLQKVIPEAAARSAIEAAYATSDWLCSPADILKKGGVTSIDQLRHKELKLCDHLADDVSTGSLGIAAADGAVTGAGGIFLAAADVGALSIVALRAILRMGHCYGISLEGPDNRKFVLGILLVVSTKSAQERLTLLEQIQDVERWVLSEAVEALAMERLTAQLIELASLEAVPGIGAFIGAGVNAYFIRQVLIASRHIFQERWLRINNKVDSIESA